MTLLVFVVSALAALAPTLLYTALVWWADRHEREPLSLLLAVFLWGALPSIGVALVLEGLFEAAPAAGGQTLFGIVPPDSLTAPVIEEIIKAAALFGVVTWAAREFDGVLDGIVYGSLVGFGFAMTENLFYFIGAFFEEGWGLWTIVVVLRAFVFGFNHAFFTACTGIGLGLAVLAPRRRWRWLLPLIGLIAAIFFHTLHNVGAELSDVSVVPFLVGLLADWGGFWLLVIVVALTWRQERRWLRDELASEVGVLLQPDEYQALLSFSSRAVRRLMQLPPWRNRPLARAALFQKRLVDLAFIKQRLRRAGQQDGAQVEALERQADQLRQQIAALNPPPTPDPV